MIEGMEPKEPTVLDAEGNVLLQSASEEAAHRKAEFKKVQLEGRGLVPKILIGGAFLVLLVLGLTVAGIALGVVIVGFIGRSIFSPKRRSGTLASRRATRH